MEYVSRTVKKKLITTDQTSHLEKSLNSITAEARNIEDNILFSSIVLSFGDKKKLNS